MARLYTERINDETPAYSIGRTTEALRTHEVVQGVSHFICHDLRALTRHILGFVQLLQERAYGQLDDTDRDHLDSLLESGKKLSILMDDLLRLAWLARIETQKEMNLNQTVEETLNQLLPRIAGRPAIRQGERLPIVLGDLSKLLLTMSNLISSTLKFPGTQSPGPNGIGSTTSQTRDRVISLRGNGVGFDMQRAAHRPWST